MEVDLSKYNNAWYEPGSALKRALWYIVNQLFFRNAFFPISSFKCSLLRVFGAEVGKNVVIKPRVNIKYPWFLQIGDNTWIGEDVWIDNLAKVIIGKNVCLSQGCLILCGNHDFTKTAFDLMVSPISLDNGVWIGAQSTVGPGTHCHTHSVLSLHSVAPKIMEPYCIYLGNPAQMIKKREIKE